MNNKRLTVIHFDCDYFNVLSTTTYCLDISNKNIVKSFLEYLVHIDKEPVEYEFPHPMDMVNDIMNEKQVSLGDPDSKVAYIILPENKTNLFKDFEDNTINEDFWNRYDKNNSRI